MITQRCLECGTEWRLRSLEVLCPVCGSEDVVEVVS